MGEYGDPTDGELFVGFPDCPRCRGSGEIPGYPWRARCPVCARRHAVLASNVAPSAAAPREEDAAPTQADIDRLVRVPMTVAFDLVSWTIIRAGLLYALQVPEFAEMPSQDVVVRLVGELTRRLLAADPVFRPVFIKEAENMRGAGRAEVARAIEDALAEGA